MASSGINPFHHYIAYGISEQRLIIPSSRAESGVAGPSLNVAAGDAMPAVPDAKSVLDLLERGDELEAGDLPAAQAGFEHWEDRRSLLAVRKWDYAFTCYEPIVAVTGCIGTYMRLLLSALDASDDDISVLFLHGHEEDLSKLNLRKVQAQYIPSKPKVAQSPMNFVGDAHDMFSLNVYRFLRALAKRGHTFNVAEFSDYGIEGYHTIKAVRLKLLDIPTTAVRLHSPHMMLLQDNQMPIDGYTPHQLTRIERELYCLSHCSTVLFGGDAMRDRVLQISSQYGIDSTQKCRKIPHPYPEAPVVKSKAQAAFRAAEPKGLETARLRIGLIGRIETRKGSLQMIETICNSPELRALIKDEGIEFSFMGKDTPLAHGGGTVCQKIYPLIWSAGIGEHFRFTGALSQQQLWSSELPFCDAFIFPSLFENFPNALLETLWLGRQTLVSSRGCMSEIGAPWQCVQSYDPLGGQAAQALAQFLRACLAQKDGVAEAGDCRAAYDRHRIDKSETMISGYRELRIGSSMSAASVTRRDDLPVAFIVPHHDMGGTLLQTLASIQKCRRNGDAIVVVDDCSDAENRQAASLLADRFGANYVQLEVSSGPSAARQAGVEACVQPVVQFVDADDVLVPDGVMLSRQALEVNPTIDGIVGIMKAFGVENHFWHPRDSSLLTVLEENYCHSGMLIRRSAIEAVGVHEQQFAVPL